MNKKKLAKISIASLVLTALIVCSILAFVGAADKSIEMRNQYLDVQVQHLGDRYGYNRFVLFDGRDKKLANIESELMYSRFYSSFTTVNINGKEYIYGTGETVTKPYFNSDSNVVISCESFDGIKVTQKLSFAQGYSSAKDMLKAEYSIDNQTESSANVGIRIMIDPMLYDDDNAVISVNGGSITGETEFRNESVPKEWSVENSEKNITVYGITECGNTPDAVQFVNWNNAYENIWNYKTASQKIEDCAVAFVWDFDGISPKENIELSTRYGFKSKDNSSSDNGSIPTSDKSAPVVMVVIAVIALAAIVALLLYKKKGCVK